MHYETILESLKRKIKSQKLKKKLKKESELTREESIFVLREFEPIDSTISL